jgi:hypothetical protein
MSGAIKALSLAIGIMLLQCSPVTYAKDNNPSAYVAEMQDTGKQEQVDRCVEEYIRKQSKSYARIVQNNLYNLMQALGKVDNNSITYDEKIETLAKIQCETYYKLGVLK